SVSESPNLASVRDDLRDQALVGLSIKMRQRVGEESRAGDIVSTMLGRSGAWAAPLVSDAQFAVRAAIKRPQHSPRPRSTTRVHLGTAVVTAACAAPATGEVFVGFADGQVVCFRPLQNEVIPVPTGHRLPVASLAVDNCGAIVVAIFRRQDAHDLWSTYTKVGNSGRYQLMGHGSVEGRGNAWLAPIVVCEEDRLLTGLWDGEKFQVRNGVHLDPWGVPFTAGVDDLSTALL